MKLDVNVAELPVKDGVLHGVEIVMDGPTDISGFVVLQSTGSIVGYVRLFTENDIEQMMKELKQDQLRS